MRRIENRAGKTRRVSKTHRVWAMKDLAIATAWVCLLPVIVLKTVRTFYEEPTPWLAQPNVRTFF